MFFLKNKWLKACALTLKTGEQKPAGVSLGVCLKGKEVTLTISIAHARA